VRCSNGQTKGELASRSNLGDFTSRLSATKALVIGGFEIIYLVALFLYTTGRRRGELAVGDDESRKEKKKLHQRL